MSTNYFAPPTVQVPRVISNPASSIAPSTLGPPAPADAQYGALENQAGYTERAQIMNQMGTGEGSIYEKYMKLIRAKRDTASAALSGYGGISFTPNDPTTAKDESLEIQQETGRTGERERSAYDDALFRSLASGGVGRAQLIGAALQRVSKEAQDIIAQYADSISNAAGTGLADQMLNDQNAALRRWTELYGTDASAFLKSQMPTTTPAASAPTGPDSAAPHEIIAGGGQVASTNDFVNGKTVYNGKGKPNTNAYRNRFKASDGYIVQEFPPDRKGGNYRVVVTFLYNPKSPGSPGIDAGYLRPPPGPDRPVAGSKPNKPAPAKPKPPAKKGRK